MGLCATVKPLTIVYCIECLQTFRYSFLTSTSEPNLELIAHKSTNPQFITLETERALEVTLFSTEASSWLTLDKFNSD